MAYSDVILAEAGLVAYWKLGETSGTTADNAAGAGLDGTFTGAYTLNQPGLLVDDPEGSFSSAGTTGSVVVADDNALDLGDGPLSLEIWAVHTNASTGNLITKGGTNASTGAYLLRWTGDQLDFRQAGVGSIALATTHVTDTTVAHHLVVTRRTVTAGTGDSGGDSVTKLYIDGVDVTPASPTFRTLANNAAQLSINGGTGGSSAGYFEKAAIYNVELSPTQVATHFAAGRTKALTDSVTSSEGQAKDVEQAQTDSVTASESQSKDVGQAQADTATASDSQAKDISRDTEADSVSVSDSQAKEPGPGLSDSVTPTDSSAADVTTEQADSVTVSDALMAEGDLSLGDTATVTDDQVADVGRAQTDSATATDSVSLEPESAQADSVSASDQVSLEPGLTEADSVSVSDALAVEEENFLVLGDSVTVTDSDTEQLSGAINLSLSDSVSVTDDVAFEVPSAPDVGGGWVRTPLSKPSAHVLELADIVVALDDVETDRQRVERPRNFKRHPQDRVSVLDSCECELQPDLDLQREEELVLALV